MNDQKRGFTLVELVIVLAVIGIIVTITVLGIDKYFSDTRDARRVASAQTIVEALEKYYDEHGEYPGCPAISASGDTLSANTLKGIDTKAIIAPQAPGGTTNSLSCNIVTYSGVDFFQYEGDGTNACNNSNSCSLYKLKFKKESEASIVTINSRR